MLYRAANRVNSQELFAWSFAKQVGFLRVRNFFQKIFFLFSLTFLSRLETISDVFLFNFEMAINGLVRRICVETNVLKTFLSFEYG